MKNEINDLYSKYKDGKIGRRRFMKKLSLYVGGTTAALSIVPLLEGNYAYGSEAGEELFSTMVKYPGKSGDIRAFIAMPENKTDLPAVIIIHENKGLVNHIKDVTKRMAAEGFIALAPDANSPLGGTPVDDPDKGREMMRELKPDETEQDFVAAVKYLKNHPKSNGKVGCTGFCWGGAMTNQVAVQSPDLKAAVPYYGRQPSAEDVPRIKASLMAHYAGNDERINAGIEDFKKAMTKAGVEFQVFMYDGASHAFNNDSNEARYHPEAAKLAWKRTVDFFNEKLR
jgi:carboxymethylenebutenolidase